MNGVELSGRERRKHPRTRVHLPLQCIRMEPDGPSVLDRLEAVDISRGGLGAITQQRYYPGQRVVVRLPVMRTNGDRHMFAKVVRCRPLRDEGYRVGLQYEAASFGEDVDIRMAA